MSFKNICLLPALVFMSICANAQNTPNLSVTAPTGSITEILVPPAITVSSGQNFIKESSPMIPVSDAGAVDIMAPELLKQQLTYLDGFDQAYQTIKSNVSLNNGTYQHLVEVMDTRFQKVNYSFLPYVSTNFGFQNNAFNAQKSYYSGKYASDGYTAYSKTESIGRNKQISYAPGKSQVGQSRGTITKKITNASDEVRYWSLDLSGFPISSSPYGPGQLYGEEIIQPSASGNGSVFAPSTKVYTNKDGNIVLKMVSDSTFTSGGSQTSITYLCTYFIYDEMGHLRYTLSPKAVQLIESASWIVDPTVLNNLCYQYHYDNKGRLSEQQFPGENGFTTFVYDNKDRVVMRQTPVERSTGAGTYEITYYDKLDRVIATALYDIGATRDEWQASFDLPQSAVFPNSDIRYYMGFTTEGLIPGDNSIANHQLISYMLYDDYATVDPTNSTYINYNNQLQFSSDLLSTIGSELPIRSKRTHGQLIATKVKTFPSPNADQTKIGNLIWNYNYFDDKGRVINTLKFDYSDANGMVHFKYTGTQYDFLGRPLITKSIFQNLGKSNTIYPEWTKYSYEAGTGALLTTSHKVKTGGVWNTTSKFQYDDLGRVKRKSLGNDGEVQDFTYNMRGFLIGINAVYAESGDKGGQNKTFGESIKYDFGFTEPRFDGKISGIVWRGNTNTYNHAYGYDYDISGRLKNAEYRTSDAGISWNKNALDYTVSNLNYDKNGNILSMDQQGVSPGLGVTTIDKLRYNYEASNVSNRLQRVTDSMPDFDLGDFVNTNGSSKDYSYDDNGNLKSDANKGISNISYTHFNKPQIITYTNGNYFEFSYDASGNKVQEIMYKNGTTPKVTDYISTFVYEDNELQYLLTPEGRTVRTSVNDAFKEEYFVKDHLSNIRSTIDVTEKPLLQYLATYELASANMEGLLFEQLNEIRDDKPASTSPSDVKSGRLNGEDQRIGTSLLMHVMAGDQVEMNVNNYYDSYTPDDDNPVSGNEMLTSIVGTLTGGVGGFVGSEGHNPDMVQQLFTPTNYLDGYRSITNNVTDASKPKAYLNYILFDENMRIDQTFSNTFQVNSNGSWQQIGTSSPLTIPTNGYLAVYLSNESRGISCYECANVSFDQLVIKLQKGNQLEETHYYPFGLPIKGLSSAAEINTIAQRKKYQSNEYIKDLKLNWMDFHARQYDPQIGRFLGVDPKAAAGAQELISPYAAMGNAPESLIDPNGESIILDQASRHELNTFTVNSSNKEVQDNWVLASGGDYVSGGVSFDISAGSKEVTYTGEQAVAVLNAIIGGLKNNTAAQVVINFRFHFVFESETPEIYAHTVAALSDHPEWAILTYNGGGEAKKDNRTDALKKVKNKEISGDRSWDEFPYASTKEGGIGSYVFAAPRKEQKIQAGQLGALVTRGNKMKSGDKFMVVPVAGDRVKSPAPYPSPRPKPSSPPSFIIPVIFDRIVVPRIVVPIIAPIIYPNTNQYDDPYEGLRG